MNGNACACGCGKTAPVSDGIARRYVHGHNRRRPPLERFWEKVDKTDSCWLWTGRLKSNGYAAFSVVRDGKSISVYAHRWAYETFVGPIPDGHHIDHLCRVRNCVRPDHLEPVTQRENNLRSMSANAIAVRTNRCKRNHEFTPENTYIRPDNGHRQCRTCIRLRSQQDRRKKVAA